MKIYYTCSECGSDKIQAKAWVSLNDITDIDFSLSESTSENENSEDYWCKSCEEHCIPKIIIIKEKEDDNNEDNVNYKDTEENEK